MSLELKRLLPKWGLASQIPFAFFGAVALGLLVRFAGGSSVVASAGNLLGSLFVGALKAIAPLLVFTLVVSAVAQHREGMNSNIRPVIVLYVVGMAVAALLAVAVSFAFPSFVPLNGVDVADKPIPNGFGEVLQNLLLKIVTNPVQALADANYIGILAWALVLGLALRAADEPTRNFLQNISDAVNKVMYWIIRLAPIGIFGLTLHAFVSTGLDNLAAYLHVLLAIVGAMAFMALVLNPLIVFFAIRKNPYPLVWTCLKESGLIAFVIRSSVANIPVNLNLCKKLGLDEETYAVTIPLGATMNMEGASITITILTLAAVHTLGIHVDFITAFLLVIIAAIGACGASGIPGGALPLVPMACSLFNISNDVAMQMVTIGLIISVVQDPCGTLLNSSTDVVFTAAADPVYRHREVAGQVETAA
ncbi:Na(+)/serine-threonine symporter [Eikenella corrodens]|uniref:Serine/threonine transporter SstT n=2 Tax=Eikenella corrodens TaxID=539 RepID=C0DU66_EIKCO|nr:serine/threonine transporter SstT [Eikenella corrodens]EEG24264.1 transporter, dicarboxylate/amino acid:cation Na+/H+ symporter family protein [Eikenella corrodens ATCC 23834]UAK75968.1 serine/threonine transporter SstT [Eikenella corrodens]SNW10743.1 Na(+)/serine-threonine symporter [Eikenella corrodens]